MNKDKEDSYHGNNVCCSSKDACLLHNMISLTSLAISFERPLLDTELNCGYYVAMERYREDCVSNTFKIFD